MTDNYKYYKILFELSPDPILLIKDGVFVDCNAAAISIMKCKNKEQLLNLSPSEISPYKQPDGLESFKKAQDMVNEVKKNGNTNFEWLHRTIDETELLVEVFLSGIKVNEEELLYVRWKNLSDKKELEYQLEYSRKRFVEVAMTSTDWVWEVNKDGIYTFITPRVKDFLGFSDTEIIGQTPFDTMTKKEATRVGKIFLDYVSKEAPFKDLENINIHKDGREIVLHTSGVPIYDFNGDFAGYRGTDRDVTAMSNLLLELKEKQEDLKEAQKLSHIGHWELNLENGSLYWSDEVYRIFGLQAQEFGATYESFLEHIHPDDHKLVNDTYSESVTTKEPYFITHRVITKQNELRYVEERCSHKLDNDGNVIKSIGTVHDITQRIMYEKRLELASNVFKYSTDSIVITDEDNKIVSINESFSKLTGYKENEVIGNNPKVLSSGWGDKEFYTSMWKDIVENGLWQGEIWDRKKSGEIYAAFQSIICIKDKDDNITNYIGISHNITEAKEREQKIQELAYYDFLTKLPNRKLFEQEVESFIKSSHYSNKKFALLFLDLDNFKWVNDSLGHRFGDKVLIEISKTLSSIISEDSIVARLGGDEFVILEPFDDTLSVSKLATEIIDSVKNILIIDNKEIKLGWSIGISLFPQNANSYSSLLQSSDTAMYEAKEKGKNNFKFFSDDMNKSAKERFEIDTRLRKAIDNSCFTLNYQPKISLKSKKITGVEALIRWNDEELGFVPPDKFIPIAEESGHIYDIGIWVLKEALNAFEVMKKHQEISIAINISSKQLENMNFYDDVVNIITESGINPKKIEFEITETSIMDNIHNVIPILNKIKDLGIRISIDDFGTGYSSMVYLKKLPIDTIKIDREFVMELEKDEEDKAIVKTILALSNALHLQTIAEGVEKKEHIEILEEMGCDICQGYYYSKPLELEKLLEFIKLN
ncbi:EAL domain-containing protein [Sulfurimonas sp.]